MLKDNQGAFLGIGDVIVVPSNNETILARVCGYEGFHEGILYLEYCKNTDGPSTITNDMVVRANNEATTAFNAAYMRG